MSVNIKTAMEAAMAQAFMVTEDQAVTDVQPKSDTLNPTTENEPIAAIRYTIADGSILKKLIKTEDKKEQSSDVPSSCLPLKETLTYSVSKCSLLKKLAAA